MSLSDARVHNDTFVVNFEAWIFGKICCEVLCELLGRNVNRKRREIFVYIGNDYFGAGMIIPCSRRDTDFKVFNVGERRDYRII